MPPEGPQSSNKVCGCNDGLPRVQSCKTEANEGEFGGSGLHDTGKDMYGKEQEDMVLHSTSLAHLIIREEQERSQFSSPFDDQFW